MSGALHQNVVKYRWCHRSFIGFLHNQSRQSFALLFWQIWWNFGYSEHQWMWEHWVDKFDSRCQLPLCLKERACICWKRIDVNACRLIFVGARGADCLCRWRDSCWTAKAMLAYCGGAGSWLACKPHAQLRDMKHVECIWRTWSLMSAKYDIVRRKHLFKSGVRFIGFTPILSWSWQLLTRFSPRAHTYALRSPFHVGTSGLISSFDDIRKGEISFFIQL